MGREYEEGETNHVDKNRKTVTRQHHRAPHSVLVPDDLNNRSRTHSICLNQKKGRRFASDHNVDDYGSSIIR